MMTIIRAAAEASVAAVLLYLSVYDVRHLKVPDRALCVLLAPVLFLVAAEAAAGETASVLSAAAGGAAGFGLLLLSSVLTKGGIGGGDIKLAGILGLCLGLPGTLVMLLAASAAAAVSCLILKIRHREGSGRIPFVPFLSAGFILPALAALLPA